METAEVQRCHLGDVDKSVKCVDNVELDIVSGFYKQPQSSYMAIPEGEGGVLEQREKH